MIREPVVAGQFYPGSASKLRAMLEMLVDETAEKKEVIAQRIVDAVGQVTVGDRTVSLNPDSLAKANKSDLAILFHIFNSEILDESEDENDSQEDDS